MKSNRCWRITTALLAVVVLAASAPIALGKKKVLKTASGGMDEHKRAVHALNRLSFGPRPGDIDRVMAMGVDQWINLELHPEKIDDSALNARLAALRTLRMDNRELVENFPSQPLIKAVADGKLSMPSDPEKHAVYMAQLERYEERQERKQDAAASGADSAGSQSNKMTDEEREQKHEQRRNANQQAQELAGLPPAERMKAILKLPTEDQMALVSLKPDTRDQLMQGLDAKQRETLLAIQNPQQVVTGELVEGKLLHAIYGERQLEEVMDDFWLNHFNVFIGKGADRYMLTSYERDVIRPHALGKFEDLLVATAQSPAMLFYLDNWLSVGPDSNAALGIPRRPPNWNRRRFPRPIPPRPARPRNAGLNENYGRELMELHTLGVNGGYTQHDVTEVARVFTGWTLKDPRDGGTFVFEERRHEPGDKYVLGHRIKSKEEKEGREVLHILAHHPATAKFISTKLAMRFVSDDPPPALVDRMAHTFLKKNGDIREVLETMLESPEFWAPEAYRAKVKTPLEFVVSAVRASGAEVTDAMPLAYQLQTMGMQLYGMQPPTGYSMKADAWINSSALLGRMNFALALAGGKMRGVQVDPARMLEAGPEPPGSAQSLAALENSLLAGEVSKQTHDTVESELEDPAVTQRKLDDPARPPNVGVITGLLLGSPEFQRR